MGRLILRIGTVLFREISIRIKVQIRAGVHLIAVAPRIARIEEDIQMIVDPLLMIERQDLTVHPLPRLWEVIARLCIRRSRQFTTISGIGKPALCAEHLVVPVAEEEIGRAVFSLMVDVEEYILPANLRPGQGKSAVEELRIQTNTPLLIFTKASADVDVLARRRAS